VDDLISSQTPIQMNALHKLRSAGRRDRDRVLRALEARLATKDPAVQWATIEVLALVGPQAHGVLPALAKVVKARDASPRARLAAAKAIVAVDPKSEQSLKTAVPLLVSSLKDKSIETRFECAQSLAQTGRHGRPALPVLLDILKHADTPPKAWVQEFRDVYPWPGALLALWQLGPIAKEATPVLEKLVINEDRRIPEFVMLAAGALIRIEPRSDVARRALHKLVGTLAESLSDDWPELSAFAAETLATLGPTAKEAIQALERLKQTTDDARLREAAERALGRIRDEAMGRR
jgi:HEAT repeat protein